MVFGDARSLFGFCFFAFGSVDEPGGENDEEEDHSREEEVGGDDEEEVGADQQHGQQNNDEQGFARFAGALLLVGQDIFGSAKGTGYSRFIGHTTHRLLFIIDVEPAAQGAQVFGKDALVVGILQRLFDDAQFGIE